MVSDRKPINSGNYSKPIHNGNNLMFKLIDDRTDNPVKEGFVNIIGAGKMSSCNRRLDSPNEHNIFEIRLTDGIYFIQAGSYGYGISTDSVKIVNNEQSVITLRLKPKKPRKTNHEENFKAKLETYGISNDEVEDIHLQEGEILNIDEREGKKIHRKRIRTLSEFKKNTGVPSGVFGGKYPRFGEIKNKDMLLRELDSLESSGSFTSESIPVEIQDELNKIYDEYVYGNPLAVQEFLPFLERAYKANFPTGSDYIGVARRNIRLEKGSSLVLPSDLQFFLVGTLAMHEQARVKIRGPTRLDVLKYEVFKSQFI